MKRWQTFLISAAGPAAQFAFGFLVAKSLAYMPEIPGNMLYFLAKLIEISLVWSVLNCLPILPLDGGQMLNAILGDQRIRITLWVTLLVASGLAVFVLYRSPGSILPAALLGMFAWQAGKALRELGSRFR
jgi:Zn-dependent protease